MKGMGTLAFWLLMILLGSCLTCGTGAYYLGKRSGYLEGTTGATCEPRRHHADSDSR